jgi:hypothetical protein
MYRDTNQRDRARALRNQPTDAEKRLWRFLRAQNLAGECFVAGWGTIRRGWSGAYIVGCQRFTVCQPQYLNDCLRTMH